MADNEPTTPDEPTDEPTDDPAGDEFNEEIAKERIRKISNEAKNLRARAREAEAKAAKYDELENEKKSELEKAQEKAKSLEDASTAAQGEAMRLRVALRKGLSETQAKRLIGANEEELEADADELVASFSNEKGKTPATRPLERVRGGNDPTEEPEEMDPAKLAEGLSLG